MPEQPTPIPGITSGGVTYEPGIARTDRLDDARPGEHVWIVTAVHVISADALRRQEDDVEAVLLDRESLAMVATGCYRCEQPWSKRLSYRRCPGDLERAGR